jgi:hypothetical protein
MDGLRPVVSQDEFVGGEALQGLALRTDNMLFLKELHAWLRRKSAAAVLDSWIENDHRFGADPPHRLTGRAAPAEIPVAALSVGRKVLSEFNFILKGAPC